MLTFRARYYVGVYDKKTGKMQICDTELFHMKPYIASKFALFFSKTRLTTLCETVCLLNLPCPSSLQLLHNSLYVFTLHVRYKVFITQFISFLFCCV